jgi:hypothetical protein
MARHAFAISGSWRPNSFRILLPNAMLDAAAHGELQPRHDAIDDPRLPKVPHKIGRAEAQELQHSPNERALSLA